MLIAAEFAQVSLTEEDDDELGYIRTLLEVWLRLDTSPSGLVEPFSVQLQVCAFTISVHCVYCVNRVPLKTAYLVFCQSSMRVRKTLVS